MRTGADLARIGFGVTHAWEQAWQDLVLPTAGAAWRVRTRTVSVERLPRTLPAALVLRGLDSALAFLRTTGVAGPEILVDRGREVARDLAASDARITPATLRAACRLGAADLEALTSALGWLRDEPDLRRWTARQLPVPALHSKWLEQHGSLLRDLSGRDVRLEVRPRLAVVHLTYVDPSYLATGARRHDAWTTGDTHELAYQPRIVVVVENRDCRLWFPPADGAVVVEGGGRAAVALLAGLPWLRRADEILYWGDIDADGFAILDGFRAAMALPTEDGAPGRTVHSLLMDAAALQRYEHLGGDHDRRGRPISPSSARLRHLTPSETQAYHAIATRGAVRVRRIEQERIPVEEAVTALGVATRRP
ncbi:MAG: hypothetical protein H5T83_04425 [Actinotalea sp.]|nr:hypothetical protein [Actinotalea sp.]